MVEEKRSILLVDDEESSRKVFSAILAKAGYLVDEATNGMDALEKARAKRYDVALVDIKLPDMEGTELLLRLPKSSEMVKIVVTGFSTTENAVKASDCGADDFLVKPVDPEELLRSIRERLALL